MTTPRLLALAALCCGAALAASAPSPASNLLTEYLGADEAILINSLAPRFSWLVASADRGVDQASFRIVVTQETAPSAVVWDSGVVASAATTHVPYAGAPLASDTVYSWTVTWTDSNGATAPASAPARFGTGLLTQAEWAPSAWIGCPLGPSMHQIRAEFDLGLAAGVTIQQARIYITAVGYYDLRVNGDWAGQWSGMTRPRLDPGWTTYEMTSLYNAYDITQSLVPSGPNAIAIMLGNGWPDIGPVPGNSSYAAAGEQPTPAELVAARLAGPRPHEKITDNNGELRQTRVQVRVRTSDGKTTTWASTAAGFRRARGAGEAALGDWMCGAGALQYDNVYNGCTWDQTKATLGWDLPGYSYATGAWAPAVLKADPGGAHPTAMTPQAFPAVTVQAEIKPISVSSPAPGVYVLDFGQNFAGFVRLTLPAPVPAGLAIKLRHAELLMHPPYGPKDGSIYVGNLRSALATDLYTTGGVTEGFEVWEPVFTYHGFRFVEVTGLPFTPTIDMVTGVHIRTGVQMAGNVVSPSLTAAPLNQLQHAIQWGLANNFMSVISDCPQRDERKGWMGDSGLSLQPTHYNYKVGAFYTAWAANIRDSQVYKGDGHPDGSVADTTPHTFGGYPSDPAWGTAYPGIVYSTWRMLGDTRIAADHYPNLQMYIAFMTLKTNSSGPGKIYQSYGDWCPPPAQLGGGQGPKPPDSFTSGIAFMVDLQRMVELATALGKPADAAAYAAYRAWLVQGFNAAFLGTNGTYGHADGSGLQTANACALGVGAAAAAGAEAAAQAALTTDVAVTHAAHWSTGIIGMRFLHAALARAGQADLALATLLQTDYPSFGWWFNHPDEPATTMNELPDMSAEGPGMNSRNHHMFASVGGWLFEDLAGIDQKRSSDASYDPADPASVGFRHAVIFPRATTHPAVGFVQAEYESQAGRYVVSWANPSDVPGSTCAESAPENAPVSFSCGAGGVFTAVAFASFGTPSGSCVAGFSKGACDAANSSAILAAACVGKSSCTIAVSTQLFGDPCFGTAKMLDAQLTCSVAAGVAISATVPTNARATVRVPFPAGTPLDNVTISEGATVVFAKGAFVSGAAGVLGASVGTNDLPVGVVTVDVEVSSGAFSFSSS